MLENTFKELGKEEKIQIFRSLFKGRDDVFSQRWDSLDGTKSAYYPVYANKERNAYVPLSDRYIEDHLRGHRVIGIYTILHDNNTHFVAADFDGMNWQEDVLALLEESAKYGLACYIERSRSGNGAHAWWFLEDKYPAYKIRKIFLRIIKDAGLIDTFDKEESFDRLFPNQDYLSKKGFGNLIALPLQGKSREQENSVFVNAEQNFKAFDNQWSLLQSIQSIKIEILDQLYNQFIDNKNQTNNHYSPDFIPVTIDSIISIPKSHLNSTLVSFLIDNLNFLNTEWIIKQRMGLPTYNIEKFFKTISSNDEIVQIPRGFQRDLIKYLDEQKIKYSVIDKRSKCEKVILKPSFELLDYQYEAVNAMLQKDDGILVAPPGAGKTIIGISMIAKLAQPALIIVHRKQIFDQWIERIQNFLDIPKKKIGQIVSSKKIVMSPITVAMIQSLSKIEDYNKIGSAFGTIIVDECHHVPAKMFRAVITKLNPYYLYGLTATPIRKHNDEKLIFVYLGSILHTVIKKQNTVIVPSCHEPLFEDETITHKNNALKIIIRDTSLAFPFKIATKQYQFLSKALTFDTARNELIINDVAKEIKSGSRCLILTERKEHVDMLNLYLKKDFETVILSGDLGIKQKHKGEKQIKSGHYQIIIATGQYAGEGTHFENINCLFLVYPFSFRGKLIQYMGRIFHSKESIKSIYDYRDIHVEYLDKMFKNRKKFYDEL